MTTINGVNFDEVVGTAVDAAKAVASENWDQLEEIVRGVAEGLKNDVTFIADKQAAGEFNEDDARAFLEDQVTAARVRLRSISIITLQIAERIWNAIAEVFRGAINTALGWPIL